MIYGFVEDVSMYKRSDEIMTDESQNQGCGYFGDKANEYFNNPAVLTDSRNNRLEVLDNIIIKPMLFKLDKDHIDKPEILTMSVQQSNKLFNIMELVYLSQGKSITDIEDTLVNSFTLYGIYVPKSVKVSGASTTLDVYIDKNTTLENIDVKNAITFSISIESKEIELTIWLSEATFLNDYPISTIDAVIHSMDPHTYLTLDYDNILDAIQKSGAYMYTNVHDTMKKHESSDLAIYSTRYMPPGGEGCQLEFGVLYKGSVPSPSTIREAIVADLLSREITTEEVWKTIFPDLWIDGLYYIIPIWDNTHVVNPELTLFKGVVNHKKILDILEVIFPNYEEQKLIDRCEVTRAVCSQVYLAVLCQDTDDADVRPLAEVIPTYEVLSAWDPGFEHQSPQA